MNKLMVYTLFGVAILSGCSQIFQTQPSESELKSQYNMLLETIVNNVRVDKVDNLKCNQNGYVFPSEKEGPIYECQALVHFMNGKSMKDQFSFYRRPEGFNGGIDISNSNIIEGLRQIEYEKQRAIELKRFEDVALEEQALANQRILEEQEQENEYARQRMSEESQNSGNEQVVEEQIQGGE